MKPLFYVLITISFISLCSVCDAQADKTKVKMKGTQVKAKESMGTPNIEFPYVANYSSRFEISDPKYSKTVLDVWKAYEMNNLDNISNYLADNISMILSDGTVINGKENFLTGIKAYRGSMTNVKLSIDAWMTTRSTDKDEHWVCVWGDEEQTMTDGKSQTISLHEIWRFNSDGKIDFLRQYSSTPPKM
jgi:hypothetical protein